MSSNENFDYWRQANEFGRQGRAELQAISDMPNQQAQLASIPREFFDAATSGIGIGSSLYGTRAPEPVTMSVSELTASAREEGVKAERARILAKLEALKPTETQYTRIQWRWEEKGAFDLWKKAVAAVSEQKRPQEDEK